METTGNMMTAVFRNREDAENAYQVLLDRGFTRDQISVLMSEESRSRYYGKNSTSGTKMAEGTGVGAALGGTIGAIIGAVAAVGTSIALPGLGLVIAGPIAAALAGAGAGGAAGGLVGALVGSAIPADKVQQYETAIREGGIVLGFHPRNIIEADAVEKIWKSYNAEHIYR